MKDSEVKVFSNNFGSRVSATYKNCAGHASNFEDAIEALKSAVREAVAFGELTKEDEKSVTFQTW